MSSNALYFPYINVPDSKWFTRVLFYWDGVSSIVPYEYTHSPELLMPYMRTLVEAGLVQQVLPMEHIDSVPNFTESFAKYVETKLLRIEKQKGVREDAGFSLLHIEKLGGVSDVLVDLGVAKYRNYPWYEVEPWAANAFMAYLATILGKQEDIDADPVTNERACLALLEGNSLNRENFDARVKSRSIILRHLFPVPSQVIKVDELVSFKLRYRKLLVPFRRRIEGICIDLATISDAELREERTEYVVQELREDVETLVEAMRSKWSKIVLSGLTPILGSAVGFPVGGEDAAIIGAGMGLVSTIYNAFDLSGQQQENFRRPLAYAALSQKRFSSPQWA